MTNNPLSTLKIDYWYKMLPVIGTILLIISLTFELKDVSNTMVQVISVGVIFFGIGEWINHPLQTGIVSGYKLTSYNRVNKLSGNLWVILGISFIVYAIGWHR